MERPIQTSASILTAGLSVAGTDYQQLTALPGSPTGSLDNDRIVREFSGGRQILNMKEDGFRQEIILDHIPSLTVTDAKKLLATISGILPLKYYASVLTATDANRETYSYTTTAELDRMDAGSRLPGGH